MPGRLWPSPTSTPLGEVGGFALYLPGFELGVPEFGEADLEPGADRRSGGKKG